MIKFEELDRVKRTGDAVKRTGDAGKLKEAAIEASAAFPYFMKMSCKREEIAEEAGAIASYLPEADLRLVEGIAIPVLLLKKGLSLLL